MDRNVYIANWREEYDFSAASKFLQGNGKLIRIISGSARIFRTEELYEEIKEKVKNITDDDWVIPCGNGVVNYLVAKAVGEILDNINILIRSAKHKNYEPRNIRSNWNR